MGPRMREDTRGAAPSKPFPIKWEGVNRWETGYFHSNYMSLERGGGRFASRSLRGVGGEGDGSPHARGHEGGSPVQTLPHQVGRELKALIVFIGWDVGE